MLELDALKVAFGDYVAVNGASFVVRRGEVFGIVGESGSGKSTVLRAVVGLAPIASGLLRYEDQDVSSTRSKAVRRSMQMVFQDPYASLNPTHVVDEIVSEPMLIHGMDNVRRRTEDALREVGLGREFLFRYPHQLSGGQRQRVAIARALAVEPELLLLDEPTSALDVSVQAEILNLLRGVWRSRGLTMVMVSHDLAVIAHMCGRVAVMNGGEIVEILGVDQLSSMSASHPYTRQLLEASAQIGEVAGEGWTIGATSASDLRACALSSPTEVAGGNP